MAKVKLKFVAMSYLTSGLNQIDLEVEDLLELLNIIKKRYPELRVKAFDFKSGSLNTEFTLLVNGKSAPNYSKKLVNGDEVIILPTISGGVR